MNAFQHWPSLVQVMACRLDGVQPLSAPMLEYCYLDLRNKFQWNFNRSSHIFIQENGVENVVYEMASILSRSYWVDTQNSSTMIELFRYSAISYIHCLRYAHIYITSTNNHNLDYICNNWWNINESEVQNRRLSAEHTVLMTHLPIIWKYSQWKCTGSKGSWNFVARIATLS